MFARALVDSIANGVGLRPHFPSGTGGKILGLTSLGIIGGSLNGLLQMPLLKPHFANSGWWIAASSAGWGLCLFAASLIEGLGALAGESVAGSSNLVVGVVTGLTAFAGGVSFSIPLGVATGVGLLWMAEHPVETFGNAEVRSYR